MSAPEESENKPQEDIPQSEVAPTPAAPQPEQSQTPKPKKSFATPEDARKNEEPEKPQPEHPQITFIRLTNALCVLVEQDIKAKEKLTASNERLVERFDKFFAIFESLASKPRISAPKSVAPVVTPTTPAPAPTPAPVEPQEISPEVQAKIDKIKGELGEELTALLIFDATSSSNMIIVKTRQYLGTENYAKAASIMRSNGGMWTSAGKASHWQVPKFEVKT